MSLPEEKWSSDIDVGQKWSQTEEGVRRVTEHIIMYGDSRSTPDLEDESVDLVITSPPYPMIVMWDEIFSSLNPEIGEALQNNNGRLAFTLMNVELEKTWGEVRRILRPGGFACVNIGDATRRLNSSFMLYPSHTAVTQYFFKMGFDILPNIIWQKQTNSPNKFMGSGMLPAGAYATQEHEYILIFRKHGRRLFNSTPLKEKRRESAYFWEERNKWFSDIWVGLKGVRQNLSEDRPRMRSGAFPFELAYRLVNMYSIKGDTVYDPFLGTGTTTIASIASERNSVGMEVDRKFRNPLAERIENSVDEINRYIEERVERHRIFIRKTLAEGKNLGYHNQHHDVPVKERTESHIMIAKLKAIEKIIPGELYEANYAYL